MPLGGCDRRTGAQDGGQVRVATKCKCHEVAITEISNGRYPILEGAASIGPGAIGERRVAHSGDLCFQGSVPIEDEMLMAVDQARQEGHVTERRDGHRRVSGGLTFGVASDCLAPPVGHEEARDIDE